jgi:hypothetical protein
MKCRAILNSSCITFIAHSWLVAVSKVGLEETRKRAGWHDELLIRGQLRRQHLNYIVELKQVS